MDNNAEIKLNRKFAYTIAVVLLLIFGYRFVFKQQQILPLPAISLLLLVLTVVKPGWLSPMRLAWDKLGHVLGIINTFILLNFFYWLILTPMGLLMRLFGKDILKMKRSADENGSYWEAPADKADSRMENQF